MTDQIETTSTVSAADALALVSDKWVVEVLHALRDGHNRYGAMQRAIPDITKKMLTQTLRRLERNGLISRIDYGEVPPRVEYSFTPAGQAIMPQLTQMCRWSKAFRQDVERARTEYDATNTSWVK